MMEMNFWPRNTLKQSLPTALIFVLGGHLSNKDLQIASCGYLSNDICLPMYTTCTAWDHKRSVAHV